MKNIAIKPVPVESIYVFECEVCKKQIERTFLTREEAEKFATTTSCFYCKLKSDKQALGISTAE